MIWLINLCFSYYFMSSYEERSLLKQLEGISSGVKLPPHINRLKRKLIVRQVFSFLIGVLGLSIFSSPESKAHR